MKPTTVKFFKKNQLLIIGLIILVLYGSLYTAYGQAITKKVNDQVLMFTNVQPIRSITQQFSTVSNTSVSTASNTSILTASNITISPQQPLSGPGGGDPVGGGGGWVPAGPP